MTNFKDLQKLFFLLVIGFSMCAFVACSDDEDEGSGSGTPSASVGEVVPGSGKKLLSAGEYKFFYTADGKIKTIELGNYERYEFTYSPNQIIYDYGYDGDGEDEEVYTVSYNEKGYISKPYIGVSVSDVSQQTQLYGIPAGAAVQSVAEDGPAATAGLQAGDIITKLNGTDITDSNQLVERISAATVGESLTLTVYRQGETIEIAVTVGEQIQDALQQQAQNNQQQIPQNPWRSYGW